MNAGEDMIIKTSTFYVLDWGAAIFINGGSFSGEGITIENIATQLLNDNFVYEYEGGGIYAYNSDSFEVKDSIFKNINYAEKGGAIFLSMSNRVKGWGVPAQPKYKIISCTFTSNLALLGGAIYVESVDYTEITSCTFDGNKAYKLTSGGDGGAIYYESKGN